METAGAFDAVATCCSATAANHVLLNFAALYGAFAYIKIDASGL